MKKRYWIFSLALLGLVFFVEYDLSKRMTIKVNQPQVTQSKKLEEVKPIQKLQAVQLAEENKNTEQSFFESRFIKEALQISQLQNEPKAIESQLDQLARQMNSLEIKKIAALIHNKNEDGDQRALGVELLSRAQNEDSLIALNDFVVGYESALNKNWNRNQEFESVLRAQAIEGIAAYPKKEQALSYLNSLAQKVNESFLKDRIARSEQNLKGNAPSAQQQDEAALRQLVQ